MKKSQLIVEWGLFLLDLGHLDAAAQCYARGREMANQSNESRNAAIACADLAEVHLLTGRLAAGLSTTQEALRMADLADSVEERNNFYSFCSHARSLRGEIDEALANFQDALHWQHEDEGGTDRQLYSLRGLWHAQLLARLGQREEARQLTEANQAFLLPKFGEQHQDLPACHLLLADLAAARGNCRDAPSLAAIRARKSARV
jgi:tetratricopeptide (TPR) repeat protein